MARPRKHTSGITAYRMNLGLHTPQLAEASGVSIYSIGKLENGERVSRVIAARYLKVFQANLNDLSTLPPGWKVEDKGGDVVFSMQ